MTISEMREKRAALWARMENFLDTHRSENGVLSADDDATYSRMEADMTAYTNEVRRMERAEAINAELNEPVSTPITNTPGNADRKRGRASDEYRADFLNALRGRRPVHNVLEEGTDANGGYLCPTEFERQIVTGLEEENVFRRIAHVITTENERKIPVAANHSSAAWTAENASYTESDPSFSQKSIDAFKLTDLVKVSVELLEDSMFNLEEYIAKEFARAFAKAEEEAFCIGNGSGKPTGLFYDSSAEIGVTAASATAITVDEIISLIYSLKGAYRANAQFMINDATVAAIRKIKDGNGVYIWQPALTAGQPDRLLGFPILTSSYVPTMAAGAKTIAFGDFRNYWIADRSGRTVQRLNELYSSNGQVGFIASERLDAKLILPEGIKLLKQHA